MRQATVKLEEIKNELKNMFYLVSGQIKNGKIALLSFDKNIVFDIYETEKKIDEYESRINEYCETYLAIYNPVAEDLRLIMAINNINPSLERIGDIIEKIGKFIKVFNEALPNDVIEDLRLVEMYNALIDMFDDVIEAFSAKDSLLIKEVFLKDATINEINSNSRGVIMKSIEKYPENTNQLLYLFSVIIKLERAGDHLKNIAEEIVFYNDGKLIKHKNY